MATSDVQELLDKFPTLQLNKERQKVICTLTKHEMPPTVTAVQSYVNGKKFKNAFKIQTYDFDQHRPHIVPSSKKKHLHELFCTLTLRHIARIPQDVQRHVKGKRFQRALARWKKCLEAGEKFIPRVGGRQKRNSGPSDSDSLVGEDNFWSGDSENDDDDADSMSDLYPHEDFPDSQDGDEDADNSDNQNDLTENLPPANNSPDHDSDYDMSILNVEQPASVKVTLLSPSSVSSHKKLDNGAKECKKKHKRSAPGDHKMIKKRKKVT